MIHPRLADIRPLDHWQQDGLHYFVFPLKVADGTPVAIDDAPVVVFTMHPEATAPVSVVVITPREDGGDAEVVDVRHPEDSYTMPLPAAVEAPAGPDGQAGVVALAGSETPSESVAMAPPPTAEPPLPSTEGFDALAITTPSGQLVDTGAEDTAPPAESRPPDEADVLPEPMDREAEDGRADLTASVTAGPEPADDLSAADPSLLGTLKVSLEYQTLGPRLADAGPVDDWQNEGLHYFVFQLRPDGDGPIPSEDAPVAVFAMHPHAPEPVSVTVITPGPDGEQATVLYLRQPGSGYAAPLSYDDGAMVESSDRARVRDADAAVSGSREILSESSALAAG